jgi:hypothetical protein
VTKRVAPPPTKRAAPPAARKRKRAAPLDREAFAALEKLVRGLRSARGKLERRLTAAVQEIGMLRQFEARAEALERELGKRDDELARLQRALAAQLGSASVVSTPS